VRRGRKATDLQEVAGLPKSTVWWHSALFVALGAVLMLLNAGPAEAQMWQPAPGLKWQWQLTAKVDTSFAVGVYDVDGFENGAAVVDRIHARDARAVCYISAGSWENWRPDAGEYPSSVKGRSNGWPGERWLDIRRMDILQPIMERRMDMCVAKGFDAIEPDNIDGYANRSGFPLTYKDQLIYNRMLSSEAHERGARARTRHSVEERHRPGCGSRLLLRLCRGRGMLSLQGMRCLFPVR
jgi:hypothetical protein